MQHVRGTCPTETIGTKIDVGPVLRTGRNLVQPVCFIKPKNYAKVIFVCNADKKPDPVPVRSFGERAIKIDYKADKELNLYEGKSHTILMCLYQLSDSNIFNELSKSKDGLNKLLGCLRFDESVVGFKRIIVQPGENKTVYLDRAEKAKWVGLVAGYYDLAPGQITHLFEIPVVIKTKGLLFKKRTAEIENMSINLILGPSAIHNIGDK
ncbi:MAG: type VI secretion lipoprotein TssJ [Deltaproteobacteria bacterium]|nr:type VI secretion lipoprotein TssJ [Deltaproteobacteria bacterium]MBW2660548.1 type VI secretion lipoprotein TssJ [Deltaproteobacteria bacterium]